MKPFPAMSGRWMLCVIVPERLYPCSPDPYVGNGPVTWSPVAVVAVSWGP
jgi:hypothetical protein